MRVTPTQVAYLAKLEAEGGPVPAAEAFGRLRMSKLSIGRMLAAGVIERDAIDGRTHYRLTQAGCDALAASRR